MKSIKSIYIILAWLTLSLIATALKLTHSLNWLTEILFALVFLLSIILLVKLWTRMSPRRA